MADDAPAGAGTDETAQHDSVHSGNGVPADAGATGERTDSGVVDDRHPNGDGRAGGNGTTAADATGLSTEPVADGALTAEPLTVEPLTVESVAAESSALVPAEPLTAGVAGVSESELAATASPLADARPGPSDNGSAPNGSAAVSAPAGDASATVAAEAGPVADMAAGPPVEPDGEPGRAADQPAPKRRGRWGRGSFWRELPVLVVIAVALAILIRTFLVQAFFIPSGSMEKTLHGCPGCSGDRVLVNKLTFDFGDPKPGEVVVFKGPPSWDAEVPVIEPTNVFGKAARWIGQTIGVSQPDEKDFVKRVIAVGGQTVACCDPRGRVTVNGVPLNEPYIFRSNPDSQPQEFGPVTVPAGRLWMMGDHRDGSADSRAHIDDGTSGTVPVSDVIGKAFVIVWPPSRWNTLGTPSTFHGLSSGPLSVGTPLGLGVVGTLPIAGLRRRRRRRRGNG
ncbi:MAG TPA: signal peptidase I [Mycobacteriales bacterium]|nr:signal peptidase I [Mycobacteriales bacterium]